jgi:hypothetical protein
MRRQFITLLLACSFFTGCYTTARFPAGTIPARLATAKGFRVVQPGSAAMAESSCVVQRVEVDVEALRNDTLFFKKLTVLSQDRAAAPCANGGPGFIALAEHPDLRTERLALNGALTWGTIIFVAIPAAIFGLVVLGCATGGCWDS